MVRITNRMMVDQAVARMNGRIEQFERSQRDLATGRRIHVPSDDVGGMNIAMNVRSSIAANTQAQRNAQDGLMWTELADSRMGTMVEQLQRVRELTILASNGTSNGSERAAMAVEIAEITSSLESLGNARLQGRPLFGGFAGGNTVAKVAGTWTYQGDSGAVTRRVSETDVVTVNVTGNQVFGFDDGEDVFTVLETLQADVTSANSGGLESALGAIDRAMDRINGSRAAVGAAANRIEKAMFRAQADEVNLRSTLSETEDTDMAKAVMELQIQEVAYQAAQAALSKALQPSLAQFLR